MRHRRERSQVGKAMPVTHRSLQDAITPLEPSLMRTGPVRIGREVHSWTGIHVRGAFDQPAARLWFALVCGPLLLPLLPQHITYERSAGPQHKDGFVLLRR